MSKVLLAVDLSYQVYRATAAHPMLTCKREFTGGLYGFFTTLAKMVRETEATHLVFCQDRKPYLRSVSYPEYKAFRKKNQDEEMLKMHKQSMRLVLETLSDLNYPVWGLDGFESDDLIGHVATKYRSRYDRIYAASNDSDLFQLLTAPNFAIYTKGIADVMTGEKLWKTQSLKPSDFMHMTAITGTHNDVQGIDRVGPVTAKKALADPALMRELRSKHAAVIDRNLKLIKLPHPEFPYETTIPTWEYAFDERTLYRSLGRYDIDVTNSMVKAFQQVQRPSRDSYRTRRSK